MDDAIRNWLTGHACAPCLSENGSERRAGVLVLFQDRGDLEVIGFCYRHAGFYVRRWAEPPPPISIAGAFQELAGAARVFGHALITAAFGRAG
jgi:hypothetical protein